MWVGLAGLGCSLGPVFWISTGAKCSCDQMLFLSSTSNHSLDRVLFGRIAQMRSITTHAARSVVCVCVFGIQMDCAETGISIASRFGCQTFVCPRNYVLDCGAHLRHLVNTTKRSVRGILCQVILTICIIHSNIYRESDTAYFTWALRRYCREYHAIELIEFRRFTAVKRREEKREERETEVR